MNTVTIIGTGTMGNTIGALLAKGGAQVEYLGRDDAATPATGDIVVLALPYPAVGGVLADRKDQLAGKVVVDISNPLDFATFDSLVVPADSSAAAEVARALPSAHVLKAFNTTFAATLATARPPPRSSSRATTPTPRPNSPRWSRLPVWTPSTRALCPAPGKWRHSGSSS